MRNSERDKIAKINDALESSPVDIAKLRQLAASAGGLVGNDVRARAWPKLMNVNLFKAKEHFQGDELSRLKQNKYYQQVVLDINRCNRRFPPGTRVSRRGVLKRQLTSMIMRVLCWNDQLHYYQGFHDIAVTFLLVLGEHTATALLEQAALHQLRDFMDVNMERTQGLLSLIEVIFEVVDAELSDFLQRSEVGHVYALSWLITWFGHDIDNYNVIVRLGDLFLASHPLMPLYIGVSLVLFNRANVLAQECDMSLVHSFLSKLPIKLDLGATEEIIGRAVDMFALHPPDALIAYSRRKTLSRSTSVKMHGVLMRTSANQVPDAVLMKRRLRTNETIRHRDVTAKDSMTVARRHGHNDVATDRTLTKLAVWTLTLSIGAMSFLVWNASNRWL